MKTPWLSRSAIGLVLGVIACTSYMASAITDEVPLGSVSGEVFMKENGTRLPKATVILVPLKDAGESATTRIIRSDKEGKFKFRDLPAGHYAIEVSTSAHSYDSTKIEVEEGKVTTESLALKPKDPYLDLTMSQKVFTPGEHPTVELTGFGPGKSMAFKVFTIDTGKVVEHGGLQKLFSAFSRAKNADGIDPAKVASKTQDLDHQIVTRDIEGVFLERPELPVLPEGFYWIQATVGDITKGTYVSVSKIGMITKTSGSQLISYVADLQTGQPVAASRVQFFKDGKSTVEATTGADGTATLVMPVAKAPSSEDEEGDSSDPGPGLALATVGNSNAVVDFSMTQAPADSTNKIFMYTDRPIYRPGDEVHFKGLIRTLKGSEYSMPAGGSADVEIHDASDTLVEHQTVKIDNHGQFNGSFQTNKETDPGEYSVKVKALGAAESLSVSLADYRKPEFVIKIEPGKKEGYTVGDKAKAIIDCQYYFGGPVVGAKIEATVSRSPSYSFAGDDGMEDEESYGAGSGEDTQSYKLVTDAQGKATIDFDTTVKDQGDQPSMDWIYHVDVSASESDEKHFAGGGDIHVNQGAYTVQVRNETSFTEPGQQVAVTVFTKTHDHAPVAGRPVHLDVGTQEWNDKVEDFTSEQTLDGVTDASGAVTIEFTPKTKGSYLVKASSKDVDGHSIEGQDSLCVEGGPYFVGGQNQAFEISLDKRKYSIGGKAKALIRSSKTGFSVLMTVEADKVLLTKVVKIDTNNTSVDLDIPVEYAPNVQIAVTAMRDKRYLEASTRLLIDDERRALNIKITPDKELHKPGETATYQVHTTDPGGKAIPADVSVSVVDESIYAIQEDSTNPMDAFYPKRSDSVSTNHSFPEIYLDGGDKGGHIPVRRKFRDTAFWSPNVRTNANGDATVTVKLPDNLTQWRTTCVGITDDTRVGKGKCDLRAAKPLMVRVEAPMFATAGDKLSFSAIVQNDTGKDADVHVRIEGDGLDVTGGEKMQTFHVPSGQPQNVQWTLSAAHAGDAKITARAWVDGGDSDAVEQVVPINPAGLVVQDRRAEIAKGYGKLTVSVSPDADKTFGRLIVNVSPTIALSMFQSLDELIDYPYGCTEQTMSRFLPAILVQKALKGGASPRPDLTQKVPEIARESLARLKKMQHGDGGWGWWEYDTSDAFMTAYVLDGLHRAKAAGYPVNQFLIDKAKVWGAKYLDTKPFEVVKEDSKEWNNYRIAEDRRTRLQLGYALAVNGDVANAQKATKMYVAKDADSSQVAYAEMLYRAVGMQAEAKEALQRLKGLANTEADMASWGKRDYFWSKIEPTSVALTALAENDPHDPMVEMAVRYLMRNRQGDWWYTTRDTAFALVGLTDYLAGTGELANPQSVTISVNGKAVKTVDFTAKSVTAPETKITIPMNQLKSGDNVIEVKNAGGVTYFGTDLRQAIAPQGAKLVGSDTGLSFERNFYKLSVRHQENGYDRLMPSPESVAQVKSGDILECDVDIKTDRPREFVMVEVPIPANVRVSSDDAPYADAEWENWWARTVIRDDRVVFFIRDLHPGKNKLTFTVRAEADGVAVAGPVSGGNMYDPGQASHTQSSPFEVQP